MLPSRPFPDDDIQQTVCKVDTGWFNHITPKFLQCPMSMPPFRDRPRTILHVLNVPCPAFYDVFLFNFSYFFVFCSGYLGLKESHIPSEKETHR